MGSAHAPSGICRMANHRAFCASQDASSAESFSRSSQGWVYGGPENTLSVEAPPALAAPIHE